MSDSALLPWSGDVLIAIWNGRLKRVVHLIVYDPDDMGVTQRACAGAADSHPGCQTAYLHLEASAHKILALFILRAKRLQPAVPAHGPAS